MPLEPISLEVTDKRFGFELVRGYKRRVYLSAIRRDVKVRRVDRGDNAVYVFPNILPISYSKLSMNLPDILKLVDSAPLNNYWLFAFSSNEGGYLQFLDEQDSILAKLLVG